MLTEMSSHERSKAIKDGKEKFQRDLAKLATNSPEKYNYIISLPSSIQKLFYLKSIGKITRNQAIKAKCLDCCGFDRTEVKNCTLERCPLFKFRPYQD